MATPPSQRYRQIGFLLSSPSGSTPFTFAIRPEELTRTEPSRLTVQQTLGGAWADSFDRGVSTITLAGHNGWRGGMFLSGEDMFQQLRATVFQGWHDQRTAALAAGQDPSAVRLYFTDSLDQISVIVAPKQFVLRRSKTSPLLMRYQITLLALADASEPDSIVDDIINALSNPLRWLAGVTGLGNDLALLQNYATQAMNVLGSIAGAVGQFSNTGVSLIQAVKGEAQSLQGEFDASVIALLNAGQVFADAGTNAFQALAADDTLSAEQRMPVMAMASLFNDVACTLSNSFNTDSSFPAYPGLYGASACSSTGGGDPWSTFTADQINPFDYVSPSIAAPVIITAAAADALETLTGDPLLLVGQTAAIGLAMQAAASGITVP